MKKSDFNEIHDQMQAIVDIMPDGAKKHKAQKAIDIVRVVAAAAAAVSDSLSKLPKIDNRKRIFRGFERTPKRRIKRMKQKKDAAYLIAKSICDIHMASANIHRIQVSPIPKYIEGCNYVPNGLYVLGTEFAAGPMEQANNERIIAGYYNRPINPEKQIGNHINKIESLLEKGKLHFKNKLDGPTL